MDIFHPEQQNDLLRIPCASFKLIPEECERLAFANCLAAKRKANLFRINTMTSFTKRMNRHFLKEDERVSTPVKAGG